MTHSWLIFRASVQLLLRGDKSVYKDVAIEPANMMVGIVSQELQQRWNIILTGPVISYMLIRIVLSFNVIIIISGRIAINWVVPLQQPSFVLYVIMYKKYVFRFQVYASKYPGFQIAFTIYGKVNLDIVMQWSR